jgi:hypothetical protein
MRAKVGGAPPLQATPPGANGPLDRGFPALGGKAVRPSTSARNGATPKRPSFPFWRQI